ncbi:MAG: 30S ribosomal protein S2, partial [Gemmatimonadales bacterium]
QMVREVVLRGEGVLFVCTKRQLKQVVESEARRCGSFWVTERWLGGTLTNFHTIKKQIRRLKELEQGQQDGAYEFHTKKERLLIERERQKLNRNLEGIKSMGRLPGVLFAVDAKKERIAIAEAKKLGIPVIAIVDTNADPDALTVPIPGNDDAIRSVSLITGALVDEVAEARKQVPLKESLESEDAATYSSGSGTEASIEDQTKRRQTKRRRRPKPEAIAARLKEESAAGADTTPTASGDPDKGTAPTEGEVASTAEESSKA